MNAKDTIRKVREDQVPPEPPETAAPPSEVVEPEAPPAVPAAAAGQWQPWMQTALELCHKKFVDERVNGFNHPQSGQYFGPVPREQAEGRWAKIVHNFRDLILNDPEVHERFAPLKNREKSGTPGVPPPPVDEPPAEPPAEPPVEPPPAV